MMPPMGEVGNNVQEGVESSSDNFVVYVDGEPREQFNEVISGHVGWHNARNGCHTCLEKVQFWLHRTTYIIHESTKTLLSQR